MKLFLKRFLLFIIFIITIHILIYKVIDKKSSFVNSDKALFIFGDSQILQGIDLKELSIQTGLDTYSAARQGAGIYDFYVFVDKVPNNSRILLSISKLSQVRPFDYEANTSPFNVNALYSLYFVDYNINDFKKIIMGAIKFPTQDFYINNYKLYPSYDSLTINQPISTFKERYSIPLNDLVKKQELYLFGIKKLINKNCNIIFIEFPYHSTLKSYDENSHLQDNFINFRVSISSLYSNFKIETLQINKDKNIMYDFSHLNYRGANLLTKKLAERINEKQNPTMYIVH